MLHRFTASCLFLLLFSSRAFCQFGQKVWLDQSDSVYGYYVTIPPSSGRVQAVLILLDGYGGNADGFLSETKIHNVAWANDILTVCVPTGLRLFADQSMITLLNRVCGEVIKKYQIRNDRFVIGGMSSGGTIALRYAELCRERPSEYPIVPKMVFDVDSPIDLLGLYRSSRRDTLKNLPNAWWNYESNMILDKFRSELGDSTGELQHYRAASPFLRDLNQPGNESFLKDLAVRSYHDVDVNWYIQNRRRSLYETNMLDASELINRLQIMNNSRADFISSRITGRRSNGQRHPHSWNIVDEIDLIQWIKGEMHFYPDNLEKPYAYEAPSGWTNELILFPMDFAPDLNYRGFEDLRFAPGWGDPGSSEKWAYTLLWWLDDSYKFDETILQKNLESYYTGLTKRRALADKLDMRLVAPAKAIVKQTKTEEGDAQTFVASVSIFDSQVTRKPATLYFRIHLRNCAYAGRNIVLIEVAGKDYNSPVWRSLDKINADFRCVK
jgi:pimeloyl-ACP methyl ester carboxylesterase